MLPALCLGTKHFSAGPSGPAWANQAHAASQLGLGHTHLCRAACFPVSDPTCQTQLDDGVTPGCSEEYPVTADIFLIAILSYIIFAVKIRGYSSYLLKKTVRVVCKVHKFSGAIKLC